MYINYVFLYTYNVGPTYNEYNFTMLKFVILQPFLEQLSILKRKNNNVFFH